MPKSQCEQPDRLLRIALGFPMPKSQCEQPNRLLRIGQDVSILNKKQNQPKRLNESKQSPCENRDFFVFALNRLLIFLVIFNAFKNS